MIKRDFRFLTYFIHKMLMNDYICLKGSKENEGDIVDKSRLSRTC